MNGLTIATIVFAVSGVIFWSVAVFADLSDLTYSLLASLGTLCWVGAIVSGPYRWIFRLIARRTTKIDPR